MIINIINIKLNIYYIYNIMDFEYKYNKYKIKYLKNLQLGGRDLWLEER